MKYFVNLILFMRETASPEKSCTQHEEFVAIGMLSVFIREDHESRSS